MMNMHERLKFLLEQKTDATRKFKELEEKSSIPAGTWKTYLSRGTRPSADLIEAAAKIWPEFAYWLITGHSNELDGNLSPLEQPRFEVTSSIVRELLLEINRIEELHPSWRFNQAEFMTKGLSALSEMGLIAKESNKSDYYRAFCLSRLKWIAQFLEGYLPELGIDETISMFNVMRGEFQKIQVDADAEGLSTLTQKINRLFESEKQKIEKHIKWMAEKTERSE